MAQQPGPSARRRSKRVLIIGAAAVTTLTLAGAAVAANPGSWGTAQVGTDNGHGVLLPDQQRVTPVGTRHLVPDGRLLSSNLSPDGANVAALSAVVTRGYLTIMDVKSGNIVQQLDLAGGTGSAIGDGSAGPGGPFLSPHGSTPWVAQTGGNPRLPGFPRG